MKYIIVDTVNLAFDGFYWNEKDAKDAFYRHVENGATNIMLLAVIESSCHPSWPDELFWSNKKWTK